MQQNIPTLISSITHAFRDIELGNGVSWHEADVLDNYGSQEQRNKARALDEKNDWTNIPEGLIGDLKFQSVLPFLDAKGLYFYVAPVMIFALKNYTTSSSLIVHSIVYNLSNGKTAEDLQKLLTPEQKECIIDFLYFCLEVGDDYFDIGGLEDRMNKYWL